jgi:hypothetical protein
VKPVSPITPRHHARVAPGPRDARASALRGRFEQLLRSTNERQPNATQALSCNAQPPSSTGQAVDRTTGHQIVTLSNARSGATSIDPSGSATSAPALFSPHPAAHPTRTATQPVGPLTTCIASHADAGQAQTESQNLRSPLRRAPPCATEGTSAGLTSPIAITSRTTLTTAPTAEILDLHPDHHVPWCASVDHTKPSTIRHAGDPEQMMPTSAPSASDAVLDVHGQTNQPPTAPSLARRSNDDLPNLIHDLVQAILHLSRSRDGHWRLTMALKPQVLDGTLVALDAQPGRMHVQFDCSTATAKSRIAAVKDDLQQHLSHALSAAQPVNVRVDIRFEPQPQAVDYGVA